jgi:AAA+ superfamily predicted ATPase
VDSVRDLRLLLASRHPLIVARMDDEARFMAFARRAAELLAYPVWTWSVTRGLARDEKPSQLDTADAKKALGFVRELQDPGVFVFHDLRPLLADPVVVRQLKEFGLAGRPGQTLVLTGPDAEVPPELDGMALPWTLEPPSHEEVDVLVGRTLDDLIGRGLAVALTPVDRAALVTATMGLTLPEIQRLILREALVEGRFDASDVANVRDAKAELLAEDGVLHLVPTTGDLADVGGLEALKTWLQVRGRGFEQAAHDYGLEAPRGVLLTGVPGCGKSLVAKSIARSWSMPLVLLDPGAIFGSYVGESEGRLRSALRTVEAMAPAVLWIDEIEKGFVAGSAEVDAGVSRRVLGAFLRWLQERSEGIFVVATCNDVEQLPPEFVRRGRFDETFFVDLPDAVERRVILELHLRRRGRDPALFDLGTIVHSSEGFSGAELEGAIVAAMYRAFAGGGEVGTGHVLAELSATEPLSRSRVEEVERMRAWARGRAVPASAGVGPDEDRRPGYA